MVKLGLEPRHYTAIEFLQTYGNLQYRGMTRDQLIQMQSTVPVMHGEFPMYTFTKKELLEKSKEIAQQKFGDRKK